MLRISACVAALCLLSFGCEEEKAEEKKPVEKPLEVSPVKAEPEVKADPEAPATASAEQQAQADVEANPLTACCRALGQRGFMQRSPTYVAAAKACGESMEKKESKTQAASSIKGALGKDPLPSECE